MGTPKFWRKSHFAFVQSSAMRWRVMTGLGDFASIVGNEQ